MSDAFSNTDPLQQVLAEAGPLRGSERLYAVGATCMLIAAADGNVSPEETDRIARTLETLAGAPDEVAEVQRRLGQLQEEVAARGPDECMREVAGRLRDELQRRQVLAYAVAVAHADGRLEVSEASLLLRLARAFGVPPVEVEELVLQVQVAQHRGR